MKIQKPTVYGVGYNSRTHYSTVTHKQAYTAWHGMFKRCYDLNTHKERPTYIGCTVSPEWHDFQDFVPWWEENYIKGYQLDKDLRVEGNKVYSPHTCQYISPRANVTGVESAPELTVTQIEEIYMRAWDGENQSQIAQDYGVGRRFVSQIKNGRRHANITFHE